MLPKFASPREVKVLEDDYLCMEIVTQMRLARGCECPRCRSKEVRFQQGRRRIHGYFACQKCNYTFSATAGTFFMGARLPLTSYVQMLTLHNALGDALSPFEACLAIGTNNVSVVAGIVGRINLVDPGIDFTRVDRILANQVRVHQLPEASRDAERFFLYCDTKSILVNEAALMVALESVVNTLVPGLVESYKRRGQTRSPSSTSSKPDIPSTRAAVSSEDFKRARGDQAGEPEQKKNIAKRWIVRLGAALPDTSPRVRTRMAWHLAAIGVDSDKMLAELSDGALASAMGSPTALVRLRDRYLNGRGTESA